MDTKAIFGMIQVDPSEKRNGRLLHSMTCTGALGLACLSYQVTRSVVRIGLLVQLSTEHAGMQRL